jgi:class 3 adenylate cyclase/tetratricopeptide (TPR) repeat protein
VVVVSESASRTGGGRLPARCPACGEAWPSSARFCASCGSRLLRKTSAGEVRKVATFLFCDVSGSTALGERLDPETLRNVMGRFFAVTAATLERHGGKVEKFAGDAVMAVFGIPQVREDDALRAVRAAAELRGELAGLNYELAVDWGVRIQARVGVNTGEVVAGDFVESQWFASGDAVNVAKRLEEAAAPGEILIGDETYRLVRDNVMSEPVEPFAVKGKERNVAAWRVLAVAAEARGRGRLPSAQLVGREAELARLDAAYARTVRDGACSLVTLIGAAGVGKSRLAAELLARLDGHATILRGRCLPYGEGITFWPVIEIVKQAAGITESDPSERARAKIASLLDAVADGGLVAERVAGLLGLVEKPPTSEDTFWGVRRLLEALAAEQPLVVVFDDAHWGEVTFHDLVEYLAGWSSGAPIMLICLSRPELLESRGSWAVDSGDVVSIALERLTEVESAELVESLLGPSELPDRTRRQIVEVAGGNPLFVEEILRMLVDDGLLRRERGVWRVERDLEELAIPRTIQAILGARLDMLGAAEREVLQRASVIGKVFSWRAVSELFPEHEREALAGHLQTLVRKELIGPDRSSSAADDAFRFRHILVRDTAYESITKQVRGELHERFADWLERATGGRVVEHDEIAGYHFERAFTYRRELAPVDRHGRALAARASARLASAGRRAVARADTAAAINLLSRAVALLEADDGSRLDLLPDLGAALTDAGELETADGVFTEAIEQGRARGDRNLEWRAVVERRQFQLMRDPAVGADEIQRDAESAIDVFREYRNEQGLSKAWRLLGCTHLMRCQATLAETALLHAVEHARRARDEREVTESMRWLGRVLLLGPTPVEDAVDRCAEIIGDEAEQPLIEAGGLLVLGGFAAMRGAFDDARAMVGRGKSILHELGLRFRLAQSAIVAGRLELLACDHEAAERELRVGYEILREIGERSYYLPLFSALLAHAACGQDHFDEALRYTDETKAAAAPDDVCPQLLWRTARAKALAARGELAQAEELARQAVELAEGTDFLWDRGDAWFTLAEVLELLDRPAEATAAARAAAAVYEAKGIAPAAERARMFGHGMSDLATAACGSRM